MGIRDSVDRSSSETVGVSLSTTNGSLHGGGASYPGGTSFQNISAKDDILHAIDGVLHSDVSSRAI